MSQERNPAIHPIQLLVVIEVIVLAAGVFIERAQVIQQLLGLEPIEFLLHLGNLLLGPVDDLENVRIVERVIQVVAERLDRDRRTQRLGQVGRGDMLVHLP